MIITWRGQTPAEFGFVHKMKELGIDAEYEVFDAARDLNKLAGYRHGADPGALKHPALSRTNTETLIYEHQLSGATAVFARKTQSPP